MKIILCTDNLGRGGKERRMVELIRGMIHHTDYQVEVLQFSQVMEFQEIHDWEIPVHVFERKTKKDLSVFGRVYRFLKQAQPDLVHSWGSMPSVYITPATLLLGIPLINGMVTDAPTDMHTFSTDYIRGKLTFPFSKVIVGNSKAGLKTYNSPRSKSLCIPNGFDFKRVQTLIPPQEIRLLHGIKTSLAVVMVANFNDYKDHPAYVAAAMQVLESLPDVSFICVGVGENMEPVKAMIPEGYQDRFIFTGRINYVESLVNACDIGVLASTRGEGISNAILEYMALGKPVVATTGGGTPEIVMDGETGFITPIGDAASLSRRLLQLLNAPALRTDMGQAGQKRVRDHYELHKMTQAYLELYQGILQKESIASLVPKYA